jgi:GntR family transcriptional regulator/MocR family aminotransferase
MVASTPVVSRLLLGPALDEFPFGLWSRLVARRHPPRDLLSYGPPAGYAPLRRAVAEHLTTSRAATCDPEQVIVKA